MRVDKWKIGSVLLLGVVAYMLLRGAYVDYRLSTRHHFTVATTYEASGGGWVKYTYSVNNIIYYKESRGLGLMPNKKRYFVKYYLDDPSLAAKVVSNNEVPKCAGEPPLDGWVSIPNCQDPPEKLKDDHWKSFPK